MGPENWPGCRRCGTLGADQSAAAPTNVAQTKDLETNNLTASKGDSPISVERKIGQSPSPACFACHNVRLHFEGVIPLGHYEDTLREAVLKTKRSRHEHLAVVLGDLLVNRRQDELSEFCPDLIVPIPMYWRRRLHRGVNSPELIAHRLGENLGVPAVRRLLVRMATRCRRKTCCRGTALKTSAGHFAFRPASIGDRKVRVFC